MRKRNFNSFESLITQHIKENPAMRSASSLAKHIIDRGEHIGSFDHLRKCIKYYMRKLEAEGDNLIAVVPGSLNDKVSISGNNDDMNLESPKSSRVKTLDLLLSTANVDLKAWEVERYLINKWDVGAKNEDGGISVEELYQVKAWLKKKFHKIDVDQLRKELMDELKPHAVNISDIEYNIPDEGCLLEVNIFDAHFGKLAWAEETGDDYNLKIAESKFMEAINNFIWNSRNYKIKRIVFPVGNDFFNSDNRNNMTSNGTPQHEDKTWMETFKRGRQLITKAIETLRLIAPVDVVVVQGNHDFERSFYLGDVLEVKYEGCNDITVDNRPSPRKYYQFGRCLIGYTHGNNEKESELPMTMATEVPEMWAASEYREMHLGHLHHLKTKIYFTDKENKGVTIRYMRSISATDSWHHLKSFIGSIKSAHCFIWHENRGVIGQFYANI